MALPQLSRDLQAGYRELTPDLPPAKAKKCRPMGFWPAINLGLVETELLQVSTT